MVLVTLIDLLQPPIFINQVGVVGGLLSLSVGMERRVVDLIIKPDCFEYILDLVLILLLAVDSLHTGSLLGAFDLLI